MKIIRDKTTKIVLYCEESLEFLDGTAIGENWRHEQLDHAEMLEVAQRPEFYLGSCYTYDNGIWTVATGKDAEIDVLRVSAKADLTKLSIAIAKSIDSDVDDIYAAAIGNRGPEYDKAAVDANNFKAANYTGDVPITVSVWAKIKGWTNQQAADDIIAAANKLASARDAIRSQRLMQKEKARTATDQTTLNQVKQNWAIFVGIVRSQLGI